MELQQEEYRGNLVEEEAEGKRSGNTIVREVFQQEEEVIAEVEVGLERIILGEGAAADMQHGGLGAHLDFEAGVLDTPAEVDLLHVGEEIPVEAAHGAIHIATDEHGGASGPEDIDRIVILSFVLLQGREDASATKGITVFVDEAARRTGIFEHLGLGIGENLRLHHRNLLVSVHHLDDGLNPMVGHLNVGIQQTEILGVDLLHGKVIASREALITIIAQDADVGIVFLQEGEGVIGGGIVGHHQFSIVGQRTHERGQKLLQELTPIPIQYYDRESNHIHFSNITANLKFAAAKIMFFC